MRLLIGVGAAEFVGVYYLSLFILSIGVGAAEFVRVYYLSLFMTAAGRPQKRQ